MKSTLFKIIKYIIENDKDSCFYENYELKDLQGDNSDTLIKEKINEWEEIKQLNDIKNEIDKYFKFEVFGFCGCYNPDIALLAAYKLVKYCDERHSGGSPISKVMYSREFCKKLFGDTSFHKVLDKNPYLLFTLYTLDNLGFIEHGTSIAGAWSTDFGKMFLEFYKELSTEAEKE